MHIAVDIALGNSGIVPGNSGIAPDNLAVAYSDNHIAQSIMRPRSPAHPLTYR
jgi:hypothetical protein